MLDVESRVDVDAGLQQLQRVLPALRVTGSRGVRVGQLVEQQQLRPARQRGVEIELAQRGAPILEFPRREPFESFRERRRVGPAVSLHPADHDVAAFLELDPRGLEHRVGLPDARRCTEEDLQASALRLARGQAPQQGVGVGALVGHLACRSNARVRRRGRPISAAAQRSCRPLDAGQDASAPPSRQSRPGRNSAAATAVSADRIDAGSARPNRQSKRRGRECERVPSAVRSSSLRPDRGSAGRRNRVDPGATLTVPSAHKHAASQAERLCQERHPDRKRR